METYSLVLVLLLSAALWVGLLYQPKSKRHFSVPMSLFGLVLSLAVPITVAYVEGLPFVRYIAIATIIGFCLEWLTGSAYSKVFGEYLWKYNRGNISFNTSWLALPLWMNAALIMWLVWHVFG